MTNDTSSRFIVLFNTNLTFRSGLLNANRTVESVTDEGDPQTSPPFVFLNYSLPTTVLVAVFLSLFVLGTVFGNFLVVLALYRYRFLRTVSNYLIGNLAVSDFLLAVTVLPLSSVNECLGHWVFGQTLCNLWLLTDVLCCTASIWNLCVIAFDRFTATLCPVWYREKRSTKQAVIYISIVWLISSSVCLPPVLGWNDLRDNYVHDNTTDLHHCILFQTRSYVIYSANGSFFLPFFLTVALYIGIFITLRMRVHRMRRADSTRSLRQRSFICPDNAETFTGTERLLLGPTRARVAGDANEHETNDARKGHAWPVWRADRKRRRQSNNGVGRCGSLQLDPPQYQTYDAGRFNESQDTSAPVLLQPLAPVSVVADQTLVETTRHPAPHRSSVLKAPLAERRLSSTQRYEQREVRATVRMAVIIAAFCGMWLGFFVLYTIRGCCPECFIPRELDAVFFWLGYSNSSVNPILYTIFNDEFKRAFAAILSRSKGSRNYPMTSRRRSTLTSTISTRWHT